ncbi:MAG: dienelactone hydrolase [Alphaproteobacteria bacterium]|nr:dienelactone hydrolase [Alphaproteobacteria bacterium]
MAGLFIVFGMGEAQAQGKTVTYMDGETALEGYWSTSTCEVKNAPIVLIVHQWKGLGEYEKSRADMLADKCYNAFAIDMYGKDIRPETMEEASKESSKYKNDLDLADRRLAAARGFALSQDNVSKNEMAVIGYCFGGSMALQMARSGADIDGAVSFHGNLASSRPVMKKDVIKSSIQVHHGADDPHVSQNEVDGFINEMNAADADWMLSQYANAVHSFTEKEAGNDPAKGSAYNEKADKRSWEATLSFLENTL